MQLARRNRGRARPQGAEQSVETIKAQAEEWVAQTREGFAEARAKLDAELESARVSLAEHRQAAAEARSALEAERERRAELERVLESERRQRAELQRRLERTKGSGSQSETARTRGLGRERNWAAAKELAAKGLSQREIARRLGINRRTVARLLAAKEPPRYRRRPQGSMLDPLDPVMRSVLRDMPAIDAPSMTEILRGHGYRGSVDLVRRRLQRLRPSG